MSYCGWLRRNTNTNIDFFIYIYINIYRRNFEQSLWKALRMLQLYVTRYDLGLVPSQYTYRKNMYIFIYMYCACSIHNLPEKKP